MKIIYEVKCDCGWTETGNHYHKIRIALEEHDAKHAWHSQEILGFSLCRFCINDEGLEY